MNISILKLARRDSKTGSRTWLAAGLPHAIKMLPARGSSLGNLAVSMPHKDHLGFLCRRTLALPMWRKEAKRAIRGLMADLELAQRTNSPDLL